MGTFQPGMVIHPGRTLEDELDYYGVTQKWLAERTGLTEKHISDIINEKVNISADVATRLANVFGGSASFWINLDANYRADKARMEARHNAEAEVDYLDKIPYKVLEVAGYVEKTSDKIDQVLNMQRFFGVNALNLVLKSQSVAFRKSKHAHPINPYLIAAWLRHGEIEAMRLQSVEDYDSDKLRAAMLEIRKMTRMDVGEAIDSIKNILFSCGVILVVSKFLNGTYINGATRWIGRNPMIQLSDRGKRDDILWFTLFHEIGHILLHSKKDSFIEIEDVEQDEEKELAADNFAKEYLIPDVQYNIFIDECGGVISKERIIEYSNRIDIAPSILLGRLQREHKVAYRQYGDLHRLFTVS